ncbi:MAG: hypothetical protein LUC89_03055 [Oscillospiraceae bacterium]|nr:hypothetical protein [Oscillospiraceae bacterium]
MKLTKKLLALLLAVALLVCGGCVQTEDEEDAADDEAVTVEDAAETAEEATEPETEETAEPEEDFPTAADYYTYIQSDILTKYNLATTDPVAISLGAGKLFEEPLWVQGETGIIGAEIHDYDGDGSLEMIVLYLANCMRLDTYFAPWLYDTETGVDIDDEVYERAFIIHVLYYDSKDGEISQSSFDQYMVLPTDGWGNISIGLEKVGDDYYLFGHMYSENQATYGPTYTLVAKLGGHDTFTYEYATVPYWNRSQTEMNELLSIAEPLQIQTLSLYDVLESSDTSSAEAFYDSVGERALCYFDIEYTDWDGYDVTETVTDYTNLRHYLETGGQDWEEREPPEGYEREVSDASADMIAFVEEIDAAAGTTFAADGVNILDDTDGIYYTSFDSDTLTLTLYWDSEAGRPTDIRISEQENSIGTGVWYAAKDAMLQSEVFGFTAEEIAPLLGQVGWTDYTMGVSVGDYTCMIYLTIEAGIWLYLQ